MERTPFHAVDCFVEQSMTTSSIPIRLAGRDHTLHHTLHFVGTHWFDMKTVLGGNETP